jgi:hypothetical protein
MLKAIAPAAIVTILAAFSATAATAAPPTTQLKTTVPVDAVQVQFHERKGEYRQRRVQRYTPGRRYRSAPSHYRRYAHRPADWRSRGCILVGPLWYCG